jgi:hypothetical protein
MPKQKMKKTNAAKTKPVAGVAGEIQFGSFMFC